MVMVGGLLWKTRERLDRYEKKVTVVFFWWGGSKKVHLSRPIYIQNFTNSYIVFN